MKKILLFILIAVLVTTGTFYLMTRSRKLPQSEQPKAELKEKVTSAAPAQGMTETQVRDYTSYLQQYQSGGRIQFDDKCNAAPNQITIDNGATIMLDNRTNQNKRISIGGNTYELAAYGYKIATLTSQGSNLQIGCNENSQAGQIKIR